MANVPKEDYEKIANMYNEFGDKATMEYIGENYGIKAPRGVLMRIKKYPGFSYDSENKKIIIPKATEGEIFMGIDEICSKKASNEISTRKIASVNEIGDITLELLYKELMQEKLMELSKYIKLNRYSNTVIIDKTSLSMDGYQITIS